MADLPRPADPLGRQLTYSIADWYAYGLFLPILIFATRRRPIDRRQIATRVPLPLGLLLGISIGRIALFQQVRGCARRRLTSGAMVDAVTFVVPNAALTLGLDPFDPPAAGGAQPGLGLPRRRHTGRDRVRR